MNSEEITLFFSQGSSDKVYQAQLDHVDDSTDEGWVVNFQYGRRGKPLVSKTKTAVPVTYEVGKKIYDKLVSSKMSKGYTPEESGVAYSATVVGEKATEMLPQLLNPVTEDKFAQMFKDWSYVTFQIKYDGENRPVTVEPGGPVVAANRRGLEVSIPSDIENALQRLSDGLETKLELATEDMGTHLVVYDVLFCQNDLKQDGFATRGNQLLFLETMAREMGPEVYSFLQFEPPTSVMNLTALQQWIESARQTNEEGVVFKDPDAPFTVGRPNSGGPQLKYKFIESATCKVLDHNEGKRSVQLGVTNDQGALIFMGNCTIPANYEIPAIGDFVEVEYLYAYPDGGSLYQPQYKGVRNDKTRADEYESLKFKG